MAVEWIKPIASRTWGQTESERRAQRVFQVKCDDKDDGPDVAAAAAPAIGSLFLDTDLGLKLVSKDAREDEAGARLFFNVTCDYATSTKDPAQQEENPLDRPQIVSLRWDSFEEPVYREHESYNVEGDEAKPIRNSAEQVFPDGVTETHYFPVITITRNEAAFDFVKAEQYMDAINDGAFGIWRRGVLYTVAAGKALMRNITTEERYENNIAFEEVTYEIAILSVGWDRKILDQGFVEDTGEDGLKPILDGNGDEVTTPAMLDGSGMELADGLDPVFLTFRTKARKDFSVFEFDTFNVPPEP